MRKNFTYRTDEEIIFKLKSISAKYGVNSNDVLDIAFLFFFDRVNSGLGDDDFFFNVFDYYKNNKE